MELSIDFKQIPGFAYAMAKAPQELSDALVEAFDEIGRTNVEAVRAAIGSGLKIRSKGLLKSYKYKSAQKSRVEGQVSKIFTDIFTKWRAGEAFQEGATIQPTHAKNLTILTDAAHSSSGRRKYTPEKIRSMLTSGEARLVKTPHALLVVLNKVGITKTGKMRKNSREEIIAILQPRVSLRKRYDFYGEIEKNQGRAQELAEAAVQKALQAMAAKEARGK